MLEEIMRPTSLRKIIALQLKRYMKKGYALYFIHVTEELEGNTDPFEICPMLK